MPSSLLILVANIFVILSLFSDSAGLKYGLFLIVTFFVVTRLPPILNLKAFAFFGLMIPPYSWILAYTRLVQTVHFIPFTFSLILLLNVPVWYGALFVASLLTSITDCHNDFFTAGHMFDGMFGTVTETLIIFASYLNLIKISNNAIPMLHFLDYIRYSFIIYYFIAYL